MRSALLVFVAMITSVTAGAEPTPKKRVEPAAAVTDLLRNTMALRGEAGVAQTDFIAREIRTNLELRPGMVGAGRPRTPNLPSLVLWNRLYRSGENGMTSQALEDLFAAPDIEPSIADDALAWSLTLVEEQLAAGGFLGAGCQCFCDMECDDATFCNGSEVCSGGLCYSGALPTCSDGNPCTTDACDSGPDSCVHNPVGPPPEVANLQVDQTTLSWDSQAGASRYNLYRAMMSNLFDLACFASLSSPMGTDNDPMASGQLKFYLATSVACGESTLGANSSAVERANLVPCP
jgi:hypothetical protein